MIWHFPEMSFYPGGKAVTLGDLLNMSAGLEWDENYFNPFNITARSYMAKDLKNLTLSLSFDSESSKSRLLIIFAANSSNLS